jgi:hypothetical protein
VNVSRPFSKAISHLLTNLGQQESVIALNQTVQSQSNDGKDDFQLEPPIPLETLQNWFRWFQVDSNNIASNYLRLFLKDRLLNYLFQCNKESLGLFA